MRRFYIDNTFNPEKKTKKKQLKQDRANKKKKEQKRQNNRTAVLVGRLVSNSQGLSIVVAFYFLIISRSVFSEKG